jgi:hypothetical protein
LPAKRCVITSQQSLSCFNQSLVHASERCSRHSQALLQRGTGPEGCCKWWLPNHWSVKEGVTVSSVVEVALQIDLGDRTRSQVQAMRAQVQVEQCCCHVAVALCERWGNIGALPTSSRAC